MTLPPKNRFDPSLPITNGNSAAQNFRDYMTKLDALVSALAAGNAPGLVNAANDVAAAAAGIAVGQLYRNGNVVHVRLV